MNLPPTRSIKELHADYRARRANPLDDARSALARATDKRADHVFIKLTPDRALAAADLSAQRYDLGTDFGPLDGITVVWKDLFDQTGELTTAGSKTRVSAPAAQSNAACVDLLENAGVCSLGRTNLSEFAFSGLGINPSFGTPANALSTDRARIPGGSSSGSAVAVALNIATIGIGTDTSGSVRIPAALNGIIGFRPSQARYNRRGVFELSASLDTVGTFARSVEDIIIVDRVLEQSAPKVDTSALDRTIFDLSDSLETLWDNDIYDQYTSNLREFERQGYKILTRSLRAFRLTKELFLEFGTLVAIEAKKLHAKAIEGPDRDLIDPMVVQRLSSAPTVSSAMYADFISKRRDVISDAKQEIGTSLIAYPTIPEFAPHLSSLVGSPARVVETNARMLSNTMIASFLDLPGIAMPTFGQSNRLPGSILLSCGQGRDETLLNHAVTLEVGDKVRDEGVQDTIYNRKHLRLLLKRLRR